MPKATIKGLQAEIESLKADIEALQEVLNEEQEQVNRAWAIVKDKDVQIAQDDLDKKEAIAFLTAAADEAGRMIEQELRVTHDHPNTAMPGALPPSAEEQRAIRFLKVLKRQVLAHRDGLSMAEDVVERLNDQAANQEQRY